MVTDRLIPMCKLRPISMVRRLKGFSMVELLFAVAILSFVMAAIFGLLGNAQMSFFNSDTEIDLRNSLRLSSEKIALELRNTGYKSNVAQFSLLDGQGLGSSDILRFSVPVLCSSSSTLLDANGNPSNWGAPLTWGCNSYTCMDANGDCTIQEYKYIQYAINASNQLERKVLDTNANAVNGGTTVVGNYITNFQISLSNDTHMITVVLTGQKKSGTGKLITLTYTSDVLLNNLGG